jgi:hypothetical protein
MTNYDNFDTNSTNDYFSDSDSDDDNYGRRMIPHCSGGPSTPILNGLTGKAMMRMKDSDGRVVRHDVGTIDERRYVKVIITSNTPSIASNGKPSVFGDTLACFFKTPSDYAAMLSPPDNVYTVVYNGWIARNRLIIRNNDKVPENMREPYYSDKFAVDVSKYRLGTTEGQDPVMKHVGCDSNNRQWQRNGRVLEQVASG